MSRNYPNVGIEIKALARLDWSNKKNQNNMKKGIFQQAQQVEMKMGQPLRKTVWQFFR